MKILTFKTKVNSIRYFFINILKTLYIYITKLF